MREFADMTDNGAREEILRLLMRDHVTGKNIIWAASDYSSYGDGYGHDDRITCERIRKHSVIIPRVLKPSDMKNARSRKMAEVFTPSWLCNAQINLIDDEWFGRKGTFNTETADSYGIRTWKTSRDKIMFPDGRTWEDYVSEPRLEITCGEAPYLASRYDVTTGAVLDVRERIGILDRKLRIVGENTESPDEWFTYALEALRNTYGFEWQGDNLLLARVSVFQSFLDWFQNKFPGKTLSWKQMEEIAGTVSGNLWQMDGLATPVSEYPHSGFKAIVGNPPYQDRGGSGGNNDAPIYQKFAEAASELGPDHISLVIKAAWFTTGRENLLKNFRHRMLTCGHIRKMTVYTESRRVFSGDVEIKGGICYYLESRKYSGPCEYVLYRKDERLSALRRLDISDVLIRDPRISDIAGKVEKIRIRNGEGSADGIISADTPFGIPSNPGHSRKTPVDVYPTASPEHDRLLYYIEKGIRKTGYVSDASIRKNRQDIPKYKIFIAGAGGSGNDRKVMGIPVAAPPGAVCSQSYLYAAFTSEEEASNFEKYIRTRFFRILVSALKVTQSAPARTYRYVPLQDFGRTSDIDWSRPTEEIDTQLYCKYGIGDMAGFIRNTIDEL